MKLFGRKAARDASAPPFSLRAWSGGAAGEWPRSYEAQVREAYLGNAIAQRSVRLVAEGASGSVVYSNEHEDAAQIVKPQLVEAVTVHLLLHGNAFVQFLCDGDGKPADLFPLRPERVSIEADATGWPLAVRGLFQEKLECRFGHVGRLFSNLLRGSMERRCSALCGTIHRRRPSRR